MKKKENKDVDGVWWSSQKKWKKKFFSRHENVYVYVPNVIGYARLLLVLASFYYANEENRPHGWGIGNGVRLRALVHLRRVGRSVCEKIQSVHRIWRGARYGDRSIGDDWTVNHPVEHVSRRAIRVHLVNILRHFLALAANALTTGHR